MLMLGDNVAQAPPKMLGKLGRMRCRDDGFRRIVR